MNAKTLLAGTSIALALTAAAATPANAVITTFASYSPLTTANFYFKNGAANNTSANAMYYTISTPTSASPGAVLVDFSFINEGAALDTAVSSVVASFTLGGMIVADPASTVPAAYGGGVAQTLIGGGFSFYSTTPITVGSITYPTHSLLLSGSFGNAVITGKNTRGTLGGDNDAPDTLSYSSAFVSFLNNAALDTSIELTSITPSIGVLTSGVTALKTFAADSGGSFAADPVPTVNGVPEPASWALMMVGFGLAGATIRRRARVQAAA